VSKYKDVAPIRAFLEGGDAQLIKASYILELAEANERLPKRQDLPDRALVEPDMMRGLVEELEDMAEVAKGYGRYECYFQGVVIVSYAWAHPDHPDPDNIQLRQVLAPAVEWYLSERAKKIKDKGKHALASMARRELTSESIDFGVFIDFASMWQKPRERHEDASFKRALNQMDLLYGHQLTVKFRITRQLENALAYSKRGWPFFETSVAQLISLGKGVFDLGRVDFSKSINCADKVYTFEGRSQPAQMLAAQGSYRNWETAGVCKLVLDERQPPLLPEDFAHHMESMTFTNGSDREAVAALQSRVCQAVLDGVEHLDFSQNPWGPSELEKLGLAVANMPKAVSLDLDPLTNGMTADGVHALLKHDPLLHLKELLVGNNKLRDAGAVALASEIQLGKLRGLNLLRIGDSRIGDEGGVALGKAIEGGHLPHLNDLRMQKNQLSSLSGSALASGIEAAGLKLICIMLYGNQIKDEGLLAISRALMATGSIHTLHTMYVMPNPITKIAHSALKKAVASRSGKEKLKNDLHEFTG